MRLLAVADEKDDLLCARLASGSMGRIDAVVSCGDLSPSYLDYVCTMANAQLLYVRGNHDTDESGYATMGGIPLDMRVYTLGGIRFAGLDGSLDYREGIVGYSEAHMRRRTWGLAARALLSGGVDVLVTHAPVRGYGDLEDGPHRGFACYNKLLHRLRPQLMLYGHVHASYGHFKRERSHPSGARIVNASGHWIATIP